MKKTDAIANLSFETSKFLAREHKVLILIERTPGRKLAFLKLIVSKNKKFWKM